MVSLFCQLQSVYSLKTKQKHLTWGLESQSHWIPNSTNSTHLTVL